MKKDILTRPFPPEAIKQRQGQGGKMLSYLETHTVIARLNEACDAWSFEVVEHQILDEEVIVVAKLTADGIVKMAFGGSSVTRDRDGRPVSIADDLKAAGSDALKKAASLLGVGLELYGSGPGDSRCTVQRLQEPKNLAAPERVSERLTQKQYAAVHSIAKSPSVILDHASQKNGNTRGGPAVWEATKHPEPRSPARAQDTSVGPSRAKAPDSPRTKDGGPRDGPSLLGHRKARARP